MDNELQNFNFEGKQVRTVIINGQTWFVGKDVAEILGYKRLQKAVNDHVDKEDKREEIVNISQKSQSGTRPELTLLINESGVYSLIFNSKLPSAKKFKKWVTSEVLPSIRKNGSYGSLPQTPEEQLALTMQVANRTVKRVDNLEKDVQFLKDTQEIDSAHEYDLSKARNYRCVELCGGKQSNFYQSRLRRRKLFQQFGRDFKDKFLITRYGSLQKKNFDEAMEYTRNWRPDYNLEQEIKEVNSQLRLFDGGLEDKKEDK